MSECAKKSAEQTMSQQRLLQTVSL